MDPPAAGLDALVVLGCKAPGGMPSAALARRLERAWSANRMTWAPLVLMSGGKLWDGQREAEVMGAWWARRLGEDGGTRESELLLELESQTTLQNALLSARLLRHRRARRVGLVTCDYHMHRARKYFAAQGLDVVQLPAPSARPWFERLRSFARERSALVIGRFERLPE